MIERRDNEDDLEFTFHDPSPPESPASDDNLVMLDGSETPSLQTDEQEGVRVDLSYIDHRDDDAEFRPSTLRSDPTGELELNLDELGVGAPEPTGPPALEDEPSPAGPPALEDEPSPPAAEGAGMADPEPYVPEDRALPLDEVELHRPEELEEPPAEKPPELSLESSRRRKLRRSLRSRKDSERRFGTARLRAVPDPKKRLIWIAVVMAVGLAGAAWWFIH